MLTLLVAAQASGTWIMWQLSLRSDVAKTDQQIELQVRLLERMKEIEEREAKTLGGGQDARTMIAAPVTPSIVEDERGVVAGSSGTDGLRSHDAPWRKFEPSQLSIIPHNKRHFSVASPRALRPAGSMGQIEVATGGSSFGDASAAAGTPRGNGSSRGGRQAGSAPVGPSSTRIGREHKSTASMDTGLKRFRFQGESMEQVLGAQAADTSGTAAAGGTTEDNTQREAPSFRAPRKKGGGRSANLKGGSSRSGTGASHRGGGASTAGRNPFEGSRQGARGGPSVPGTLQSGPARKQSEAGVPTTVGAGVIPASGSNASTWSHAGLLREDHP